MKRKIATTAKNTEKREESSDEIREKNFINEVAKCYRRDSLALFVGQNLSKIKALQDWRFDEGDPKKHPKVEPAYFDDFAEFAQYYENEGSLKELKESLSKKLEAEKENMKQESAYLGELEKFRFRTVWTTRIDCVLEELISQTQSIVYFPYKKVYFGKQDVPGTQEKKRGIMYKFYGDIEDCSELCLSRSEQVKRNDSAMMTFFKRDLVAYNFLFVDYDFSDQLVLQKLAEIKCLLGSAMRKHYAIIPKENKKEKMQMCLVKDLYERYNIEALLIEGDKIQNTLEKIWKKIIQKNVFISGSLPPAADNKSIFDKELEKDRTEAMALCNELIPALLANGCKIYTGLGSEIGRYVVSSALSSDNNLGSFYESSKKLKVCSFDEKNIDNQRRQAISECNIMLFMYGKKGDKNSTGVAAEFNLAKKKNLYLIPLGYTGGESKSILNHIKPHIIKGSKKGTITIVNEQYRYLRKRMNILTNGGSARKVSDSVVKMINEITNDGTSA